MQQISRSWEPTLSVSPGSASGAAPLLYLADVQGVLVRGCTPPTGTAVFLKLQGPQSIGVTLAANDFSGVDAVAQIGADVPRGAIAEMANRTH